MTADEERERWEIAKAVRADRPRWVVIWDAPDGLFRAYPDFRVHGGMRAASGSDRGALEAEMDQIEQVSGRRGRPGKTADG